MYIKLPCTTSCYWEAHDLVFTYLQSCISTTHLDLFSCSLRSEIIVLLAIVIKSNSVQFNLFYGKYDNIYLTNLVLLDLS
jgi:hypothetical protein